jgi:hypothetical protein
MTKKELFTAENYQLVSSFHIDDMAAWIKEVLQENTNEKKSKKFNKIQKALYILTIFLSGLAGGYYIGKNFSAIFDQNLLLTLLIIPILAVHEVLHALAFRLCGAKKIDFGYNSKSFMIYAYADDFPTNMKHLAFIAILPFATITIFLLLFLFCFSNLMIPFILILVFHSIMCIGDFALVKYAIKYPDHYTVDEIKLNKRTYFFKPKF